MTFSLRFVRTFVLILSLAVFAGMLPAAGVDGAWNFVFITEIGDRPLSITLTSDGENVSGPLMNQEFKGTFRDGKLVLKMPDFYSPDAGFKAELSIEGTVTGDRIEGTWSFGEYSGPMRGSRGGAAAAPTANVSGTWNFTFITEVGDKPATMSLTVTGETVTGTAQNAQVKGTFKEGILKLTVPDFYSPDAGFQADLGLEGKVNGDSLEGRWTFAEYSGVLKGVRAN